MNIPVRDKDIEFLKQKEIALIVQVLDFIARQSEDKRLLNKLLLEWMRLLQRLRREKQDFLYDTFKDIEMELKKINRKLV